MKNIKKILIICLAVVLVGSGTAFFRSFTKHHQKDRQPDETFSLENLTSENPTGGNEGDSGSQELPASSEEPTNPGSNDPASVGYQVQVTVIGHGIGAESDGIYFYDAFVGEDSDIILLGKVYSGETKVFTVTSGILEVVVDPKSKGYCNYHLPPEVTGGVVVDPGCPYESGDCYVYFVVTGNGTAVVHFGDDPSIEDYD